MTRLGLALLIFSVLAAAAAGCRRNPAHAAVGRHAANEAAPVVLAPAVVRPVTRWIEVVGTLDADQEVVVSAKVGGRVQRIEADLGGVVPRGALLAQIDPTDYVLAVTLAEASLHETLAQLGVDDVPDGAFDLSLVARVRAAEIEAENAQAQRDRARALRDQPTPAISPQESADYETAAALAQANVAAARADARALIAIARTREAALAQARQSLRDAAVHAPESHGRSGQAGVYAVAARLVDVGHLLAPGTPMFRLVDADPIRYRVRLAERFAPQVAVGQSAQINAESAGVPLTGIVARVSPAIDPASRTCEVEIDIANPDGRIKPGGFARGRIAVRADDRALFVPANAVVNFAGVERLYSVRDGKAVDHRVVTGARDGDWVEIVSGLDEPADVVVEGHARLAPGVEVSVGGR